MYDLNEVKPEIFRACDIRGVIDKTLTENVAYLIGRGFGTLARQKNQRQVVVGRDGRHSGAMLIAALTKGLLASGVDVIDLGQVPTPLVYFATFALNTGTGIMITGSHNPPDYNGFKMMLDGDTLAEEQIQQLYEVIKTENFSTGAGKFSTADMITPYIARLTSDIKLARPLKIVVDCGNGVVGVLVQKLFEALGAQVIPLYCDVDGDFPNHHPDPGQPANLQDLIKTVIAEKADLGFGFDGDGDRLGLVTNQGAIIWPDRLMMLFSQDILQRLPGSSIIYDVKCSKHLGEKIRQWGGEPVMYKTGHALIKRKMREIQAPLSGEMSGHFFFKERWYGFDDACYSAARLLEIISQQSEDVTTIFQSFPDSINTPEINVAIAEDKKFAFIEQMKRLSAFEDVTLITVDGIRAELVDGWGLVRASNTTPCLVLRFEADNEQALARIKATFKTLILGIAPELQIPF